jgi:hypothetical protein
MELTATVAQQSQAMLGQIMLSTSCFPLLSHESTKESVRGLSIIVLSIPQCLAQWTAQNKRAPLHGLVVVRMRYNL